MKGQMAHSAMGVAGGAGLIGMLVFAAALFFVSVLFSLVKIAVFAFCAITLANAAKNPKEITAKKLALLVLCVPLCILSGYLLLIDMHPAFLNVFASEDPSICKLHASPIFTLNPLRLGDTMQMGYYGTVYYDDCMRQNPRFGKDLEFCNEIDPEMHPAGGKWANKDCIEAAVGAGATNCEAIDDSYLQTLCLEDVGMENVSPEDCMEMDDEGYRSECLYAVATGVEDCGSIPEAWWGDMCLRKFASAPEDCAQIPTESVQYRCYIDLASVMEDCEEIPDEIYRTQCIKKVATSLEDCEKMYRNDHWADCVCKFAAGPEDCEVLNGEHWKWKDCVDSFEEN